MVIIVIIEKLNFTR